MRIGCHVSVAGGFINGLNYAHEIGCECFQFFAKSPRQWNAKLPDPASVERYLSRQAEIGALPAFSHTAYLINLSTSDDVLREKSTLALADELVRAGMLQVEGVVTHIGNDRDVDPEAAVRRVGEAITIAVDAASRVGPVPRLLLENTAGAGFTFGGTLEQIAACIHAADLGSDVLGVCIDTCHAFAEGSDLTSQPGWEAYLCELDDTCGLDRLGLVHANDCKFEMGSNKDRHAWIGDGFIGDEGFRSMLCDPRLASVSCVTEMPGETPEKDVVNLERLAALRDSCVASQ